MSEHHGSYSPDPDPSGPEVTWSDQACLICGRPDVTWTYRFAPEPSASQSFALPRRIYLCDDCHILLEERNDRALADRLRSMSGDWPAPEDIIQTLRGALTEEPLHR